MNAFFKKDASKQSVDCFQIYVWGKITNNYDSKLEAPTEVGYGSIEGVLSRFITPACTFETISRGILYYYFLLNLLQQGDIVPTRVSLTDSIRNGFNNIDDHDIIIFVGKRKIYAHKVVLNN